MRRVPTRDEIQAEVIDAIDAERDAGRRSTLVQKPTQCGKTRSACKWMRRTIERRNSRSLVLAHSGELLDQWGKELDGLGVPFVVEKSTQYALEKMLAFPEIRVCLGSQQTFRDREMPDGSLRQRLSTWPRDFFSDLIADECHLSVARTWTDIFGHFDPAFRLGLTATIDRLDGVPLGKVYDSTAYCYPIEDAIANGHRARFWTAKCEGEVSIRGLNPNGVGQFSREEVASRLMPKLDPIAKVVARKLRELGVRKFVAFLPNTQCAYAFADLMTQNDFPSAGIKGEEASRRAIIEGHKKGDFAGLCNQKLLGMGYSDPQITAVVDLSPTTSRAWHDQKAGRCGASAPGKEFGYLLYIEWQADHSLMGPTDIFAGDMSAEVKARAREKALDSDGADPQELLAAAIAEIEAEKEAAAEKDAIIREAAYRYRVTPGEVEHLWREFDPLARKGLHRLYAPQQALDTSSGRSAPATRGQCEVLRSFGIDPEGMSETQARPMVERILERDLRGLADPRDLMAIDRKSVV